MTQKKTQVLTRRTFLGVCGGLATSSVLGVATGENTAPRTFKAAAVKYDITPEPGISLAGHFQDRTATHAHDPLYARCLVLDDGNNQLTLVMVDSCIIPQEIFDDAKTRIHAVTGMPTANIMIAATHTHTAPSAVAVFQSNPVPGYAEVLAKAITKGVCEARDQLAPARIGWGAGAVPDEVFNRRWLMKPGSIPANPFGETTDQVRMNPPRASEDLIEPAGPTDPEVPFIAIIRPDGTPVALLANYALHYVGGTDAGAMSADYFGCFAKAITELLVENPEGTPFIAMMSNGTSGNINNINFREAAPSVQPYEQMTAVADKVAREVHRVYKDLAFNDWVPLGAATGELVLETRRPNEAEIARAEAIVAAAASDVMQSSEEVYARETILLQHYPAKITVPLQALRIGELAVAAIPCEVFVEIGLHLKKVSPHQRTFTIELANGYYGYLPTAEQHALGGYETWRARSSFLEVHAADKIQTEMERLLHQLKA